MFSILSHLWRVAMDGKATRIALYNQQLKEERRMREEREQLKREREREKERERKAAEGEGGAPGSPRDPGSSVAAAIKRKEFFNKRIKELQDSRPRSFHLQSAIDILKATMTKDMLICRMEREFYSKFFRMLPRDEPLIAGKALSFPLPPLPKPFPIYSFFLVISPPQFSFPFTSPLFS